MEYPARRHKNQLYLDRAFMSIKMNTEARFGIQLEGNPSVSAVSVGANPFKTDWSDRVRFGLSSTILTKRLVYQPPLREAAIHCRADNFDFFTVGCVSSLSVRTLVCC